MDDRPFLSGNPRLPKELLLGARGTRSSHDMGTAISLFFQQKRPKTSHLVMKMWEVHGGVKQIRSGDRTGEQELVVWYFSAAGKSRKKIPGFAPGVDNGPNTRGSTGNDYKIHMEANHRLTPSTVFRFYVSFDWNGQKWEKMWWARTTPAGRFPGTGRTY